MDMNQVNYLAGSGENTLLNLKCTKSFTVSAVFFKLARTITLVGFENNSSISSSDLFFVSGMKII